MPSLLARCAVVALVFLSGCAVGTPEQKRAMYGARSVDDVQRLIGTDKLEKRIAVLEARLDACGCAKPPAAARQPDPDCLYNCGLLPSAAERAGCAKSCPTVLVTP